MPTPLRALSLALSIGLLAGCGSDPLDDALDGSMSHSEAAARATSLGSTPQDPAIVASDTYVLADVRVDQSGTVYPATPVYDAVVQTTTSRVDLALPPSTYSVEVGYDSQGRIVFNQYATGGTSDPTTVSQDAVRTVKVRGNAFNLLTANGSPIDASEVGGFPTLSSVVEDPNVNRWVVTEGLIMSQQQLDAARAQSARGGAQVTERGREIWITETAPASATGSAMEQSRVYAQSGSNYVLSKAVTTSDETTVEGRATTISTVTFTNVRWQNNADKNAARKNGTSGPQPELMGSFVPEAPCEDLEGCDGGGSGGGTGGGGSGGGSSCSLSESGVNLAFVHGINSAGSTWGTSSRTSGVRGYLRCAVNVDEEVIPSFLDKGHRSHASQTTELTAAVRNRASSANENQFIFVAHSQGGIISRRTSQQLVAAGESNLVRGVISIGTPHQGANVIRNLPAAGRIGAGATFLTSQVACRVYGGCQLLYDALRLGIDVQLGASSGTAAATDLRPGSSALTAVNAPTETFRRYGIQHYISKRWAFARVAGDGTSFGGRRAVTAVDIIVGASAGGAIISFFTGNWFTGAALANIVVQIVRVDAYYHRITAGNDRTDGVVEGSSQLYPRAILNVAARNATSHPGETKREESAVEVRDLLINQFGVPPRTN